MKRGIAVADRPQRPVHGFFDKIPIIIGSGFQNRQCLQEVRIGHRFGMKRDAGITRLITASLGVDFIASARIGQWVAFEPEIIKLGSNLCFVQCFVTADGERIARANGTFSVVRKRA